MAPKRELSAQLPHRSSASRSDQHRDKRLRELDSDSDSVSEMNLDEASSSSSSQSSSLSQSLGELSPFRERQFLLPTSKDPRGEKPQTGRFNIITALCRQTDILLMVVRHLPPRTIVNLHSISAPFHYQFCSRQEAFIRACVSKWAPGAENVFPWRYYEKLCVLDPALRTPSVPVAKSTKPEDTIRRIPTLKWLRMVTYRYMVTNSIVAHLYLAGHTCNRNAADALRRLWFAMDFPLSSLRLSIFRNRKYVTDLTIFCLQQVMIKLDMYFTDPICVSGGERCARILLLAEWSLTPLWNALRGRWSRMDALRLWCRHCYNPFIPDAAQQSQPWYADLGPPNVMGVPLALCGKVGMEMWGMGTQRMIRTEQLVVGEGIRRRLGLERLVIGMMRAGYLDMDLKNIERNLDPEKVLPERLWARELRLCRAKEKLRIERQECHDREKEVQGLLTEENEEWIDLSKLMLDQEDLD